MRKNIKEKLNIITNMSITRETLIALTQRYKSLQFLRFDLENRIQDNWSFSFNSQIDNCAKLNCRVEKARDCLEQQDRSINNNRRNEIFRLFLRDVDNSSSNSKNKRTCYNCGKKKYIAKNCFELKQDNTQVNIIENSW